MSLLIPESPMQVLPTLAKRIGLNESLFVQQVHYWLQRSGRVIDGKKWVYNTIEGWQEQFFFLSVPTMKRAIQSAEKHGVIISCQFGTNRTKHYTIDYSHKCLTYDPMANTALDVNRQPSTNLSENDGSNRSLPSDHIGPLDSTVLIPSSDRIDPMSLYTETTTEKTTEISASSSKKKKWGESQDIEAAESFIAWFRKVHGDGQRINIDDYANTFRLIRTIDQKTHEETLRLIPWAFQSDFWFKVMTSAAKFRKHYLTMAVQMRNDKQQQSTGSSWADGKAEE